MLKRSAGAIVTVAILAGVAMILILNLDLGPTAKVGTTGSPRKPVSEAKQPTSPTPGPAKGLEHPIGDPVEKNHIEVAAVWLPGAAMDDMAPVGSDLVHLEADVKATEGNPNGFALGEFVPYLKMTYTISENGRTVDHGALRPMVAADGLHYGANVAMPKAAKFRLTYAIEPPSAGGLGRHSDKAMGVAPWWKPFEVDFDWDYPGPPAP